MHLPDRSAVTFDTVTTLLQAGINKAKLDFEPAAGAAVEKVVKDTIEAPPALVERMQKILAGK